MADEHYDDSASEHQESKEMDPSVKRALVVAAVLGGAEIGLGAFNGNMNVVMAATDAALIGASSYASDAIHRVIQMPPTCMQSAVFTAAIYAGGKMALGSKNLIMDFLLAAAVDYGTDCAAAKWMS